MLDSIVLQLESLQQDDYFEKFLVLLGKEKKQGRNYIILSTIPVALHYRLIQEDYTIQKRSKVRTRFFFFKKDVYYYKVEPSI